MNLELLEPIEHSTTDDQSWSVIIYNDDHTDVNAVIAILMAATNCTVDEAHIEVWEAEHYGKATVHFAAQSVCEQVAQVISTIGVKTSVQPEWPS